VPALRWPPRPPRLARWLLAWLLAPADRPYALSDLDEEFEERAARDGAGAARRWYRRQALRSALPAAARRWRRHRRATPASTVCRSLAADLRQATRRLRADLRVAVTVVAMLAAASGAAIAAFSVMDSFVEHQAPFPGADRMFKLRGALGAEVIAAMREHPAFERVEGTAGRFPDVETSAGPLRVVAAAVTPGLFDMLGAAPLHGRLFLDDEGTTGRTDRVVLSYDLWRSSFGGDRTIVGKAITLDDAAATVVGVARAGLRYPAWNTQLWMPLDAREAEAGSFQAHVRLAPAVTRNEALDLVSGIRTGLGLQPEDNESRLFASPLVYALPDHQQLGLRALGGGTLLIFLAVCANVGSLLLAQVIARRRELETHLALGASPGRVLRQALVEHGAVAATGLGIGLWVADVLIARASALFEPIAFQTLNPLDLDGRAMAVAGVLGTTAVLCAGVLPAVTALRSTRPLARGSARQTASRAGARGIRVLLVCEIALACTLLLGASVLIRSFVRMTTADRGFRSDDLGTAAFLIPPRARVEKAQWAAYAQAAKELMASLPGVRDLVVSDLSLPGPSAPGPAAFEADRPDAPTLDLRVRSYAVEPGFFDLHEIPILSGRTFERGDAESDVVIGSALAARLWPDENPVGRTFRRRDRPFRVVGLAGEVTYPTIEQDRDGPEFYRRFTSSDFFSVTYRCDGPCPSADMVDAREAGLPPGLRLSEVSVLDDVYGAALDQPRRAAVLALAFSAVGLLTAAAGLFSVLTYAVSRRRREFGIRAAIGASPAQLRAHVVGEGARVALMGLAVGAAGAWALGRAIAALQYGVTTADPISWIVVLAGTGLTTLAAAWRPAAKAMRADPSRLLRDD
jgi:predicted permease